MRYLLVIALLFLVSGCACLTYEAPNGTKVSYTRFLTGSDIIKGKVGDATIEAQGQQVIDINTVQTIISILGRK